MRRTMACMVLLCSGATAQPVEHDMRPGLWQLSTTSALLALAPQLSERQRQDLDKLARQYGFSMPKIRNGAAISEVCITPDMARRKIPPVFQHRESGCEVRNAARDGDRYAMDLVCTGTQVSGSGRASGAFNGPEQFTGRSEFNGVVHGAPVNEQAETSGKWLRAQC